MNITLSNNQTVEIRELTTGDIFDAQDATKSVHIIETGTGKDKNAVPVFVVDHVLFERLLLLQSIKDVDGDAKVADINWLRNLSPDDYEALQSASEKIDAATLSEVGGGRGRDSAAS